MTEVSVLQHLEKAYALAYKAQRLVGTDRSAYRIYKELREVIESLEFYMNNNIDYDGIEVSNKLRMYEKQLKLIEEKKDSLLLRSFRQMSKLGSLPNLDVRFVVLEGEKMIDNRTLEIISSCWVKYRHAESIRELDEDCKHILCTFILKIAKDDEEFAEDMKEDVDYCRRIKG